MDVQIFQIFGTHKSSDTREAIRCWLCKDHRPIALSSILAVTTEPFNLACLAFLAARPAGTAES